MMKSGAIIWKAAVAAILCVGFAGLDRPARAQPSDGRKQLVIAIYKSEAAAREALAQLKAMRDRGQLDLEAHELMVKDAGGKVKIKERRAKGTRAAQAVSAVGGVLGVRTGFGVGASVNEGAAYLTSNVIAMRPELVESLKVALEPGDAALVSAVDARNGPAATKLQEASAASVLTYDLPTVVVQPDGTKEPAAPIQRPQVRPN
jgi:uncharacterized membrane protein